MRQGKVNIKKLMKRKNRQGYFFVMPFIIGLAFVFVPTIAYSLIYSFSDVQINFNDVSSAFVGWRNYTDAFMVDVNFRQILLDAIKGMLGDTLIILMFSFFIANVLNQKFLGRGLARTIFFLPVILATGIVASAEAGNMLMNLYQASSNTGDAVASAFNSGGMSSFFNLKEMISSSNISPKLTNGILYAISNTYSIVNSSGVQILIFISALQSINPSIFEAVKVEGATKWEEFWKITFPILTPMILVNIVYTVVDSFTNPKYRILEYIQSQAFDNNRMGYSSALSWIFFVVILVVMGVMWGTISKRIQYLD